MRFLPLALPLALFLVGAAPAPLAADPRAASDDPAEDGLPSDLPKGLSPETPVHLNADELVRDESGKIEAKGNVRLIAGPIVLGAERVHYDPEAQTARLYGPITLVDGAFVARASEAFVDLGALTGVLDEVALFEKVEPQAPEELLKLDDVVDLRKAGRNQLEVHAKRVTRLPDGSYTATGPSVTTCDCGDRAPDWRIGASSATLSPNDRLRLTWPVVYARGVPILALPYVSLPMTNERKTGFLFAVPHITGRRGPSYEQPFYLVLGQSYDLTISAGYYFGNETEVTSEDGQAAAQAPPGTVIKEDPFQGPRGSLEFRYTPRIGTAGRLFLAYGYDISKRAGEVPGNNPNRFGTQLDHSDDWGHGLADRLAINLVSDRNYVRDFVDDIILRGEQTLRSTAWVAKRQGSSLAVVEGVFQQDLRPAFGPGTPVPIDFRETLRLFGDGTRDTFQRVPAAAFDLARQPLPFGAGLSLHLGAAHFAPWTRAAFGDLGLDGIGPGDFGYPGPDAGEGDGIFERGLPRDPLRPGEIPAVSRVAIRPTLSLPLIFGDYLSLTPYGGWREQFYAYDQQQGSGIVGWGVAGVAAHSEIARTFSNGVRHSWIPRLEARSLLPGHERDAPIHIYDELDERPTRTSTQGRASLGTQLLAPGPTGGMLSLDIAAGQDVLLSPDLELSESFASADFNLWPFGFSGLIQWAPRRGKVTESVAQATWSDRRGDQLRASYRSLAAGASTRLRAAPDEIFADRFFTEESPLFVYQALEQIGAGATVVPFRWLTLSYDLIFLPDLSTARILQQQASIGLRSSCDCWSGALYFAKRRNEGLSFWVAFNLGTF